MSARGRASHPTPGTRVGHASAAMPTRLGRPRLAQRCLHRVPPGRQGEGAARAVHARAAHGSVSPSPPTSPRTGRSRCRGLRCVVALHRVDIRHRTLRSRKARRKAVFFGLSARRRSGARWDASAACCACKVPSVRKPEPQGQRLLRPGRRVFPRTAPRRRRAKKEATASTLRPGFARAAAGRSASGWQLQLAHHLAAAAQAVPKSSPLVADGVVPGDPGGALRALLPEREAVHVRLRTDEKDERKTVGEHSPASPRTYRVWDHERMPRSRAACTSAITTPGWTVRPAPRPRRRRPAGRVLQRVSDSTRR